jgi:hypothetical protein
MKKITISVPQIPFKETVLVVLGLLVAAVVYLFLEVNTYGKVLVAHQKGIINHKQLLDVIITVPTVKEWFILKANEEMAKKAKKG